MKAIKIIIASVALALVASPAFAAKSRGTKSYEPASSMMQAKFYIGVSGGVVSTDVPTLDAALISKPATNANAVFIGYDFNKYAGAELGYTSFNNLELGADTVVKSTAASLSVVGKLPMGQVADLFVKAGYASTSTQVDVGAVSGTAQTLGGATYGGGVQFNLGKHMNVRLAYDVYKITPDGTNNYTNNVSSLGVMFRF